MELIRPLYLVKEADIEAWRDFNNLRFLQCACRFTEAISREEEAHMSKRQEMKELIAKFRTINPHIETIFSRAWKTSIWTPASDM